MQVIINGKPDRPILLIKELRYVTRLSLRDSKRLVDQLLTHNEVLVECRDEDLDYLLQKTEPLGVVVSIVGDAGSDVTERVRARARAAGIEEVLKAPGITGVLYKYFRDLDNQE